MAPKKVSIPLSFGRADRVDPKFAPFGTLAVARNLRVRKDGRLGSRTGYQPLTMVDSNSNTLTAYDLHEFQNGRLCALGSSKNEGYPTDIYEYRSIPSGSPWRSSDETGTYRYCLTPFTYPSTVSGIPQPSGGVDTVDCASGNGYVCTVYKPTGSTLVVAQIVRESDDQVIFARTFSSPAYNEVRVAFGAGRFFFLGTTTSNSIVLSSFIPGTSNTISSIATVEPSGFSSGSTALEINAITNPSTGAVIVAYCINTGSSSVIVKRYTSTGTQDGSTLTVSSVADPVFVDIEADATDNTVNVLHGSAAGLVLLRTYNFSNTLLDGPTTCATGTFPRLCRLPARTGFVEHVAVAVSTTNDISVQYIDQDLHTVTTTRVIGNANLNSRMITASSEFQTNGVVFGGFTKDSSPTNCLWYLSTTIAHQFTRDLRSSGSRARLPNQLLGLNRDTSTNRIAWTCLYLLSASGVESFTCTTLDLNTARRRQSTSAGGLLYLTGAPVQVYDGHEVTESGFNEIPSIISATAGTGGSMSNNATYSYVLVYEYTLPDGTFFESPPSPPLTQTTNGSQNKMDLVVRGPHTERVALGDATYGAGVTLVLYRTVWDSVNLSQGSQFQETRRISVPNTLADYGDDIAVSDSLSDANLAVKPILYTQAGPVENNAPEGASYIDNSSARVIVAGLPRPFEFQESKEQELDEAINFSGLSSFIGRAPNPIIGILSLDGTRVIFTRTDIYTVSGEGPGNDASGALPQPVQLATPGGLRDWRSLLKGPDGVWFQLDSEKLYRMPRGTGAPEWQGIDIQDTLRSYPVITGACRSRADDSIVFACENSGSSDGRVVVRSLRTGLWTEDSAPLQSSQGIEAISSYGDQLAYISGGVVYAQIPTGFTDGSSTAIVTQWKTNPIYPFELGGNGKIFDLMITGEYRSAGTLALRVSYNDGISFTTYPSFVLSGLTAGETIYRKWAIAQDDIQNLVAELTFTPTAPSEGLIINQLTLLVEPSNALRDLSPSELA